MHRWLRSLASLGLCAVGLLTACAPDGDVVGAASESDTGNADDGGSGDGANDDAAAVPSAGEFSGEYELQSYTLHCEGDCSAPSLLGPLSYCDVGESDTDYVRVDQDGTSLRMDLDQGRLEGHVDENGVFSLEGTATEDGGSITITGHFEGAFTGRHGGFAGTITYAVGGEVNDDHVDCHGELEVTGMWESDACSDDPTACPAEYPICYQDACNAGTPGDPCSEAEDCAAGSVCFDDACAEPSGPGGACTNIEHCSEGLLCFEGACQAGAVGDACGFADDCAEGLFCVMQLCSAGEPGDACWSGSDCTTEICVDEVCTTGATGGPCSYASDCQSGICYEGTCQDGEAGDPCTFDSECATGHVCGDTDVCTPG